MPWIPAFAQGCPGNERMNLAARAEPPGFGGILPVDEPRNRELSVRYQNAVLGGLLKELPRRRFAATVAQHKGDKDMAGRRQAIEAGATYVSDKSYADYPLRNDECRTFFHKLRASAKARFNHTKGPRP